MRNSKIKFCITQIEQEKNYRKVHAPDYQRVRLGEHFEVLVSEYTRLAFIMDFLTLHTSNFCETKIKHARINTAVRFVFLT